MLGKFASGYMESVGKAINNFKVTLPSVQSDLAKYAFKDPYVFSFIGTMALQHERDIENHLADKVTNEVASALPTIGDTEKMLGDCDEQ